MSSEITICFPTEADVLRWQCDQYKDWTVEQRLQEVANLNVAADAVARACGTLEAERKYQAEQEEEWQRIMRAFIKEHVKEYSE